MEVDLPLQVFCNGDDREDAGRSYDIFASSMAERWSDHPCSRLGSTDLLEQSRVEIPGYRMAPECMNLRSEILRRSKQTLTKYDILGMKSNGREHQIFAQCLVNDLITFLLSRNRFRLLEAHFLASFYRFPSMEVNVSASSSEKISVDCPLLFNGSMENRGHFHFQPQTKYRKLCS